MEEVIKVGISLYYIELLGNLILYIGALIIFYTCTSPITICLFQRLIHNILFAEV